MKPNELLTSSKKPKTQLEFFNINLYGQENQPNESEWKIKFDLLRTQIWYEFIQPTF